MFAIIGWSFVGLAVLTVAGVWGWIETQPPENDYGERHKTS